MARNGGVVMVNFLPGHVSEARRRWDAARAAEVARYNSPPFGGLYVGQPERATAALCAWQEAHPKPPVTLGDVADHIEHIRKVAGADHVGLGSDGIAEAPRGLEGLDKSPALLQELAHCGWTDVELAKVAGANLPRVLRHTEAGGSRLRHRTALDGGSAASGRGALTAARARGAAPEARGRLPQVPARPGNG